MGETASRALEGLRPGEVVGGYRIERHVATGGWARVYKAFRISNEEPYALKTVRPELAGDLEYQRLFEREQTVLRKLRYHPNLRPPVDWSREDDGLLWLAMPWIEGPTLRELVSEHPPSPVDTAELIAQAAEGLHTVHTADPGLVHRDLHPRNLMIEDGFRTVVIDFGLAKRFEHSSGSPFMPRPGRWSSPEAVRGLDLTPQSDIYSLGLLAAFAATGAEPDGGPVLPRAVHVPRQLRAIVSRATEAEPSRRFRSAQEFADRLHDFARRERREQRRIAVGRTIVLAGAVALVSFFVGSLVSPGLDPSAGKRMASGPLSVMVPASWQVVATSRRERGVGLRAGAAGDGTEVMLGELPLRRVVALSGGPGVYEVALPSGHALRLDRPAGLPVDRVFVFGVGNDYPVVACRGKGTGWKTACEEVATGAALPQESRLPPHPAPALGQRISASLQRYSRARARVGDEIAAAAEPAVVVRAAERAVASSTDAARIAKGSQLDRLRRSFAAAAASWRSAARAARRENEAGFRRAGQAVKRAERRIRRVWRSLAELGYRIPVE